MPVALYKDGLGVPRNYIEAVKWYRLAAEQGHADAQCDLGILHGEGQGVPEDYIEAAKWFRLAAEQGQTGAQFNLGSMYDEGQGVPQDYKTAYIWLSLSAANSTGDLYKDAAELRCQVAKKLSAKQLEEAQQIAKEWKPKQKMEQ